MKKAIFTDLGNVVVPFDHRRITTSLFERLPEVFQGADPEEIHRIMWLDEPGLRAYVEYEVGALTP
jgi:hypothetical protein